MIIGLNQKDTIQRLRPDQVRLSGLIGQRHENNRLNRLHYQEEDLLLWPFLEHCPVGSNQPHPELARGDWAAEFMGTWLDAAVLSAWYAQDDFLKKKIAHMVDRWLSTQQEDGYLGSFDEQYRWQSWDVWVQAHNIIGLRGYYNYTGDSRYLQAAKRMVDRLLQDFGQGKRYLHTGPHCGMASSAILEPAVWLYTETGDQRYLDFGNWLVDECWEAPGGPAIVSSLLSGKGVAGTANAKGIEMLLTFAGLIDLYRATREERYLKPVLTAWQDIVEHHLYITGSASTGEHFMPDYTLHNDGLFMLGETCVTVGWMYINLSLGRLTGESRYFDMVEQALYNHLLGAQSPDGQGWAYYLGLRDAKRYRWHTDPECCPSKGVRMLAMIPAEVFGLTRQGIVINFYESAAAELSSPSNRKIKVTMDTQYPWQGNVRIKLELAQAEAFTVALRLPGWCRNWNARINDKEVVLQADEKGYLSIERTWQTGDLIILDFNMPVQAVMDRLGNRGRVAVTRGPLVYAADSAYLPTGFLLDDVVLSLDGDFHGKSFSLVENQEAQTIHILCPILHPSPAYRDPLWPGERYQRLASSTEDVGITEINLVPFLEAGNQGKDVFRKIIARNDEPVVDVTFQVWLPYKLKGL
jgi:DUF1680 family protein